MIGFDQSFINQKAINQIMPNKLIVQKSGSKWEGVFSIKRKFREKIKGRVLAKFLRFGSPTFIKSNSSV